jgi:hypothetical protein
MDTLCTECQAAVDRWTFIDPKDARGIAQASGRPAIETIRSQIAVIRTICQDHHRR